MIGTYVYIKCSIVYHGYFLHLIYMFVNDSVHAHFLGIKHAILYIYIYEQMTAMWRVNEANIPDMSTPSINSFFFVKVRYCLVASFCVPLLILYLHSIKRAFHLPHGVGVLPHRWANRPFLWKKILFSSSILIISPLISFCVLIGGSCLTSPYIDRPVEQRNILWRVSSTGAARDIRVTLYFQIKCGAVIARSMFTQIITKDSP